MGERPAAIVVPRAGSTLDDTDIKDQVSHEAELGVISKYAVPERVYLVDGQSFLPTEPEALGGQS